MRIVLLVPIVLLIQAGLDTEAQTWAPEEAFYNITVPQIEIAHWVTGWKAQKSAL